MPPAGPFRCRFYLRSYLLFIGGEMFKECDSSGVSNHKFGVIAGRENSAAALRIESLNEQFHGKKVYAVALRRSALHTQPCPYPGGLPVLAHAHQRGNYSLHGRGLVSGNIVLGVTVRMCVPLRVPVHRSKREFVPLTRSRKLYLYFCVHDLNGSLMSTKSAVDSVSMALLVIASKA
nr:MAG TPA: hypothetical protein [Caudoviricetes sp.]